MATGDMASLLSVMLRATGRGIGVLFEFRWSDQTINSFVKVRPNRELKRHGSPRYHYKLIKNRSVAAPFLRKSILMVGSRVSTGSRTRVGALWEPLWCRNI